MRSSYLRYEIVIHNLHTDVYSNPVACFYVDRRSPVGNPNAMRKEADRSKVCKAYDTYFRQMIKCEGRFQEYIEEMLYALHKYGEVHLYCWCVPKQCHAQTIKNYLLRRLEGEQ